MNTITPEWLLIFIGLFAISLELIIGVSTGFDLVVIGVSLLLGGVVGLVFENWQIGLTTSILLATAYILLGRKYLRQSLAIATHTTNIDRLMGKKARVVRAISAKKSGQVELDGEIWRAVSKNPIPLGSEVTVEAIEGVTLNVVESGE